MIWQRSTRGSRGSPQYPPTTLYPPAAPSFSLSLSFSLCSVSCLCWHAGTGRRARSPRLAPLTKPDTVEKGGERRVSRARPSVQRPFTVVQSLRSMQRNRARGKRTAETKIDGRIDREGAVGGEIATGVERVGAAVAAAYGDGWRGEVQGGRGGKKRGRSTFGLAAGGSGRRTRDIARG